MDQHPPASPKQPQLRKHTEVTRRAGSAYFRRWVDISFSSAPGWARTCSIGFRRPHRRTSAIPMCPSSVSPAPGFTSSTRKPENSSARTDAATGSVPARTQAPRFKITFLYCSAGTDSAAVRNASGVTRRVTGSNGEPDCAGEKISNGTSGNFFKVCNGHHGPGCRRGLSRQGRRPFRQK
jgi:hypothetical protein